MILSGENEGYLDYPLAALARSWSQDRLHQQTIPFRVSRSDSRMRLSTIIRIALF
jgi:hypothetical protein